MALSIPHPHLHHPHTRTENVMLWAVGLVLAASLVAALFIVTSSDNAPEAVTHSPAISVSTAYTGPISALTGPVTGPTVAETGAVSQAAVGTEFATDAYPWPDRLADAPSIGAAVSPATDAYPWPDRLADSSSAGTVASPAADAYPWPDRLASD